ncbi:MAG: thiamine pyrophosphate-dependent enzyme, partial [Cutibacterium avidum]|nr:thiamine pyrophosphate-dependent enzyme [Cutibacterium avidum]
MTDITTEDRPAGLAGVPLAIEPLKRRDFASDQEVRWCPGCGDYAILSTFQGVLPDLGIAKENAVVISGIGCSSRFPYYMNTYGMHSIHGRAPAIATGVAVSRPDLAVFVITGDGDALSIGGNHLIHAMRRNVNLTILMFNNRCSFVARAVDSDRKHLAQVLAAAAKHRGTSFVEMYQNCPIFNDGAFDDYKGPEAAQHLIRLVDGEPVLVGADGSRGVVRDPVSGQLTVADVAEVGMDHVLVHDSHRADPSLAFELAHLDDGVIVSQTP